MVEAQLTDDIFRASTPTQGRYFTDAIDARSIRKDVDLGILTHPSQTPEIYDRVDITTTPTSASANIPPDRNASPRPLHGDESGDMPDSSMPADHTSSGPNRRRTRSQLANAQRLTGHHPSQLQQQLSHPYSASSSSESVHGRPLTGFYSQNPQYAQRPSYVGQYTMPTQPSPIPMVHSSQSYAFSPYHHPPLADNNMLSPNIHASYRGMLQPPHALFPYQHHSPDGASSSQASFSGSRNSPMYPSPHQVNPSPSPTSMSSSGGQSNALSPSYVGSGQFHSLRYTSPMTTNPYPYSTQSFSPSPMYQSQYPPPTFGQHYTPTGESEPQGTWYYLPHAPVPSPQQYDNAPSLGHYPPVTYPGMGHTGEGSFGAGPSSSSNNNPTSPTYPMSPVTQAFSQYNSEQASSTGSPRGSGAGPPLLNPSPGIPASASSGSGRHLDKPVVRRSYHPNPPAHRSEWVMWAGNVPSDAIHDELWRFFNQPPEAPDGQEENGVLSIFLISRSSCAFVNYKSEQFLHAAIARFNGVPLRPNDSRCARLVCRVRRKDDDLKAGVGGQRGMGMHTRWVKEQKGKQKEAAANDSSVSDDPTSTSSSSVSERMAHAISTVSISSDEHGDEQVRRGVHAKHSSSSGSYTSTNSSFLTRNFPKRYFILKSLTQYDLDLSVQRGVWATQKHNEEILDQAFRTSQEVYLIFGVNKSGEFYGYARMTGPVRRGDQRVSWASRSSQSPTSRSSQGPPTRILKSGEPFFSPSDHRLVDNSPLPVDKPSSPLHVDKHASSVHSAPALLGQAYHLQTLITPLAKHSLDQRMRTSAPRLAGDGEAFELDPTAPQRAIRHPAGGDTQDKGSTRSGPPLQSVEEVEEKEPQDWVGGDGGQGVDGVQEEPWGECFAVQWLSTEKLPFHRTRHLRNPWNHDREVKVSRDGTELEPGVGERLLDEWERLADPQAPAPGRPGGKRPAGPKNAGSVDGIESASKGGGKEGTKGGQPRS